MADVTLTVDTSAADTSLKNLSKTATSTGRSIDNLNTKVKVFSSVFTGRGGANAAIASFTTKLKGIDFTGVANGLEKVEKKLIKLAAENERLAKKTEKSFSLMSSLGKLVSFSLAIEGVRMFSSAVGDTVLELQRMKNVLTTAVDYTEVGSSMQFVTDRAMSLGTSLSESVRGFSQLAAAAQGTTVNMASVKQMYDAIQVTATALSMSQNDLESTFKVFVQVLSKGKVSAEELRQQLGERLPGAFAIAARSIGVTQERLSEMLKKGELYSEEFLPKFSQELIKTFSGGAQAASEEIPALLQKVKNSWMLAIADVDKSGGLDPLKKMLKDMSTVLTDPGMKESFREFITVAVKSFVELAKTAQATLPAVIELLKGMLYTFKGIEAILGPPIRGVSFLFKIFTKSTQNAVKELGKVATDEHANTFILFLQSIRDAAKSTVAELERVSIETSKLTPPVGLVPTVSDLGIDKEIRIRELTEEYAKLNEQYKNMSEALRLLNESPSAGPFEKFFKTAEVNFLHKKLVKVNDELISLKHNVTNVSPDRQAELIGKGTGVFNKFAMDAQIYLNQVHEIPEEVRKVLEKLAAMRDKSKTASSLFGLKGIDLEKAEAQLEFEQKQKELEKLVDVQDIKLTAKKMTNEDRFKQAGELSRAAEQASLAQKEEYDLKLLEIDRKYNEMALKEQSDHLKKMQDLTDKAKATAYNQWMSATDTPAQKAAVLYSSLEIAKDYIGSERYARGLALINEQVNADKIASAKAYMDSIKTMDQQMIEEEQKISELYNEGLIKTLEDYQNILQATHDRIYKVGDGANASSDEIKALNAAIHSMGMQFTDTFVDMIGGAKLGFRDLINAMIKDLLRLMMQLLIIEPFIKSISRYFNPTSTKTAIQMDIPNAEIGYAAGGWITEPVFGYGVNTGKIYSFAETEPEYVIGEKSKKDASSGSSNVIVNVNNSGQDKDVQATTHFNGREMVVDLWMQDIERNARVARTIRAMRR